MHIREASTIITYLCTNTILATPTHHIYQDLPSHITASNLQITTRLSRSTNHSPGQKDIQLKIFSHTSSPPSPISSRFPVGPAVLLSEPWNRCIPPYHGGCVQPSSYLRPTWALEKRRKAAGPFHYRPLNSWTTLLKQQRNRAAILRHLKLCSL